MIINMMHHVWYARTAHARHTSSPTGQSKAQPKASILSLSNPFILWFRAAVICLQHTCCSQLTH